MISAAAVDILQLYLQVYIYILYIYDERSEDTVSQAKKDPVIGSG